MIPIVRRSLAISLLSVYSCSVCYVAAEPGDKTTKGNTPDQDHVTTIVGDREAPAVSNVLPWRNMGESRLSKTVIDASVLHGTLDPLDPDTLQREIQFHEAMSTQEPAQKP